LLQLLETAHYVFLTSARNSQHSMHATLWPSKQKLKLLTRGHTNISKGLKRICVYSEYQKYNKTVSYVRISGVLRDYYSMLSCPSQTHLVIH